MWLGPQISNSTNLKCTILSVPKSNLLCPTLVCRQTKSLNREPLPTSHDQKTRSAVLKEVALFGYQRLLPAYRGHDSYPLSIQYFGADRYRFVRLSRVEGISATNIFNTITCYHGWVRIEELSDSSLKLAVLSYTLHPVVPFRSIWARHS